MNLKLPYLDVSAINGLAKNYYPLAYNTELKKILKAAYPNLSFDYLTKYELHKLICDILSKRYNGEQMLKYKLFNLFKNKKLIGAFEINVKNSRADFLTINGDTRSYEIKSELDNLQKLKKQASDYIKAFEYNTVVIGSSHLQNAIEILPDNYGVWCFDTPTKEVFKDAKLNTYIDSEFQLLLLTKKEREANFKINTGEVDVILKEFNEIQINSNFKKALKERYQKKWSFIVSNSEKILPFDLQFFFKKNINPEIVYA